MWLWRTNDPPLAEQAWGILSPEEIGRAQRFRQEAHRVRFLCARCGLRHILARYLSCQPAEVSIRSDLTGKPRLDMPGAAWLHFNLSHSGELAVVALRRDAEVGVDVEKVRAMPNLLSLVERFFSAEEAAAVQSSPEVVREELFFRMWTCKEAVLKGCGTGLAFPLDQVPLSWLTDGQGIPRVDPLFGHLLPSEDELLISRVISSPELRPVSLSDRPAPRLGDSPFSCCTWWVWEWQPAPGYFAATASAIPWHLTHICWWRFRS